MQALILAAGMGKRLKQLTKHAAKCMVEVNGISMISRALKQLDTKKLSRIVIVVGHESNKLISYIDQLGIDTPIVYVENKIYDKTNNIYSLFLAKDYLKKEDTILLESDLIFESKVLDKILEDSYSSLVLVAKFDSWMDGTVVTLDNSNKITGMYDKKNFKFEEVDSYYKTVNIYKFSKNFSKNKYIPFLEAYCKALGKNEYYEQVLKVITMLDQTELKAICLENEQWYEIDDIQDLHIAETIFAQDSEKLKKLQKAYGGYWRYPKLLDYCYLVNPYYPPAKLISELKNNMEVLIRNYPSGQNVNSLLAAKYFGVNVKNICVGNGAAELIKTLLECVNGNIGVVFPTFQEYPNRIKEKKIISFFPANDKYYYGVTELIEFFENKDINNLILINPDNPSGNYIPYKDVKKLIKWCKNKDITIIVDESFVDFSEEGKTCISEELILKYNNLIVIKSISKSYGVPGIRLGVLVSGNDSIICNIKKRISIWNINSFGEYFLQIFEKYENDYQESLKKIKQCRNELYNCLSNINGLEPIESQANYIMCRLEDKSSSQFCEDILSNYNIFIKDLSQKDNMIAKNYIRIAIRTKEENALLVQAIQDLLR